MNSFYSKVCISAVALVCFIGPAVFARQMVENIGKKGYNHGCPTGSSSVGGGYCRVDKGRRQYILRRGDKNYNNGCPTSSRSMGNGYCEVDP